MASFLLSKGIKLDCDTVEAWTMNCKVFIKLNGTPEEAKVLVVRDITELDKYD